MAKKITPRENCFFCHKHPCVCTVTSREALLRKQLKEQQVIAEPVEEETSA